MFIAGEQLDLFLCVLCLYISEMKAGRSNKALSLKISVVELVYFLLANKLLGCKHLTIQHIYGEIQGFIKVVKSKE